MKNNLEQIKSRLILAAIDIGKIAEEVGPSVFTSGNPSIDHDGFWWRPSGNPILQNVRFWARVYNPALGGAIDE